jgi:hypothetical protein
MSRMARITALLMDILREIFDESAYQRFLALNGMASSRVAYAQFMRERDGIKMRTPKCC